MNSGKQSDSAKRGQRFSDIADNTLKSTSQNGPMQNTPGTELYLERLAYPALDQKPFADLTTEDVIEVLSPIAEQRNCKKASGPDETCIWLRKDGAAL